MGLSHILVLCLSQHQGFKFKIIKNIYFIWNDNKLFHTLFMYLISFWQSQDNVTIPQFVQEYLFLYLVQKLISHQRYFFIVILKEL